MADQYLGDAPAFHAEDLVREAIARGARVFRMREVGVFALTNDPEVASWLVELGARSYTPTGARQSLAAGPLGAYKRAADGPLEWDLWIHIIPVLGEESVWEAAGKVKGVPQVEAVDYR